MKNKHSYPARTYGIGLILFAVFTAGASFAQGTIDVSNKFDWSENSGWQNWRPTHTNVTVVKNGAAGYLSGYAWAENIGWVKMGVTNGLYPYANTAATNYGVNMDAAGKLSGYAWSETCGWINFSNTYSQVTISTNTGSFNGYAWGENVGWVHFKNITPAYNVSIVITTTVVTLSGLNQTYNGSARVVTATTVPEGLTVNITYNGNSWAPTNAGTYAVTGVVNDVFIYQGSVNGTLTVNKADQTITNFPNPGDQTTISTVGLRAQASSGLSVTNFTVLSGPGVISGLTNLTFTNSGSVSVTADQSGNMNYNAAPAVTNTFTVAKPMALVTLHNLMQTYNGSARSVSATTVPAGLTVSVTYDGNSWAPTNVGTYVVTGVVVDNIYEGAANGVLTIFIAAPSASSGSYQDKVMVYWDTISSAISYQIWRGTTSNSQTASLLGTSAVTYFLDTALVPDVLYYYWIQAVTASGPSGFSLPGSGYCGTIANLTSPTGVQASNGYSDRIRISWQAVASATRYEVWRNTEDICASAVKIGDSSTISYDDFAISRGAYYFYWIKAKTTYRDGDFSASAAGWTRLDNPSGVDASDAQYPYHVHVTWTPVANAGWYEVWRETIPGINSSSGNLELLARTNGICFNDYQTKSGVYYKYKIKAFNGFTSSIDYGHDTGHRSLNTATTSLPAINDYDGDSLSDLALFNSQSGTLDVLCSALGRQTFVLSAEQNQGVTGDYDGDRLADPVAYCPDSGIWLAMLSSMVYSPVILVVFGGNGAGPAAADFDGDGLTDGGVYNETDGVLSAILSNGGAFDIRASCLAGGPGYYFVSADFDGDGLADPTVYSESEGLVTVMFSGNEYSSVSATFGGPGRSMYAADFDGDQLTDPVLYEQTTGIWIALLSSAGYSEARISFGGPGYVPVIGDYDGDGLSDPAIYQPAAGQWMIMFSASGYSVITETFGGPEYQPMVE